MAPLRMLSWANLTKIYKVKNLSCYYLEIPKKRNMTSADFDIWHPVAPM